MTQFYMETSKIKLTKVSLVAVATTNVKATVEALRFSARNIDFYQIILISHENHNYDGIKSFKIKRFKNVGDWGKFVVFDLHKYIASDYIILIHHDGFIVNPYSWRKNYLNYDYIGAPWPISKDGISYLDSNKRPIRIGNSVSLRSKKLLKLPSQLKLEWKNLDGGYFHEDGFLCVQKRKELQNNGIKFAPLKVAKFFSREYTFKFNRKIKPFMFHKWYGKNYSFPSFVKKSILERVTHFLKNIYVTIKYYE
jgi:hypothetical protein